MPIKFHSLPDGSYCVEGDAEKAVRKIVDYACNDMLEVDARKLDLNHNRTREGVDLLVNANEIKEAYVIEGTYKSDSLHNAAVSFGNPITLLAIVFETYKGIGKTGVIPFNLHIKEEDLS